MTLVRPSNDECLLFQIPSEILLKILLLLPTQTLLPLTVTSTRIHDLIIRILHRRLLHAASLHQHKLILECFHPASKFSEPYMVCEYLGTPGLSGSTEGEGLVYESGAHTARLGKLAGLYSRFRPRRRQEKQRLPRAHPAGGSFATWLTPSQLPLEERDTGEPGEDGKIPLVAHRVSLDPEDSFSQLCVVTNLAKPGPRHGLFDNIVTVSDGLVRIWRPWLKERASAWGAVIEREGDSVTKPEDELQLEDSDKRTLWLDNKTNIGVTVRIKERKWRRAQPVIWHQDEEPAVSYSMEYEELLVKTTHLLMAVEESLKQEQNTEKGKAMVFGTFVNRS